MADYSKYGFVGVLPKPYKMEELAMSIKQTMAKDDLLNHRERPKGRA
jgi:hypothetical protein